MANAAALRAQYLDREARIATEAVRLMVNELIEAAPLGETGETRRGIGAVPGGDQFHLSFLIRSTGKGGDYVEEGAPAHDIEPVTAQALRFLGGGRRISQPGPNQRIATRAGGVVFAKKVHMPARPPRPWFRPVVDRWGEFLERAKVLTA